MALQGGLSEETQSDATAENELWFVVCSEVQSLAYGKETRSPSSRKNTYKVLRFLVREVLANATQLSDLGTDWGGTGFPGPSAGQSPCQEA